MRVAESLTIETDGDVQILSVAKIGTMGRGTRDVFIAGENRVPE
jgi:hypothetical protein